MYYLKICANSFSFGRTQADSGAIDNFNLTTRKNPRGLTHSSKQRENISQNLNKHNKAHFFSGVIFFHFLQSIFPILTLSKTVGSSFFVLLNTKVLSLFHKKNFDCAYNIRAKRARTFYGTIYNCCLMKQSSLAGKLGRKNEMDPKGKRAVKTRPA